MSLLMDTIDYLVDDCVTEIVSFSDDLHASMLGCTCTRFHKLIGVASEVKGVNLLSLCIKADDEVLFNHFFPMMVDINMKKSKLSNLWGKLFMSAGYILQTSTWVGILYRLVYQITPNYSSARAHILEGAVASQNLEHFFELTPSNGITSQKNYINLAIKHDNIPLLRYYLENNNGWRLNRFREGFRLYNVRTVAMAKFCLDYMDEVGIVVYEWEISMACKSSGWNIELLRLFATHQASNHLVRIYNIWRAPLQFVEELAKLRPCLLEDSDFVNHVLEIKGIAKSELIHKLEPRVVKKYKDLRNIIGIRFVPGNALFHQLFQHHIKEISSMLNFSPKSRDYEFRFDVIAKLVRTFKPEEKYMKEYAEYIVSGGLLPCIYGRRVIAKCYLPK